MLVLLLLLLFLKIKCVPVGTQICLSMLLYSNGFMSVFASVLVIVSCLMPCLLSVWSCFGTVRHSCSCLRLSAFCSFLLSVLLALAISFSRSGYLHASLDVFHRLASSCQLVRCSTSRSFSVCCFLLAVACRTLFLCIEEQPQHPRPI